STSGASTAIRPEQVDVNLRRIATDEDQHDQLLEQEEGERVQGGKDDELSPHPISRSRADYPAPVGGPILNRLILVSPWCDQSANEWNTPSYLSNRVSDMLHPETVK
ncbi:unnamed protein product, partial [Amoebophrya sp. A25]